MPFTRLKELGLSKAPSCYALFRHHVAKHGIQSHEPSRRLRVKTMVNKDLLGKWRKLPLSQKAAFQAEARERAQRVMDEKKRLLEARSKVGGSTPEEDAGHGDGRPASVSVYRQDTGEAWRREEKLGGGAYGTVWALCNTLSGVRLAGKECPDLAELQKEQSITGKFRSPFVVSTYGYCIGPRNSVMLLMERASSCLKAMLEKEGECGALPLFWLLRSVSSVVVCLCRETFLTSSATQDSRRPPLANSCSDGSLCTKCVPVWRMSMLLAFCTWISRPRTSWFSQRAAVSRSVILAWRCRQVPVALAGSSAPKFLRASTEPPNC